MFGKDAYVQINKDVCFDTRDGKFDYNLFAVICAIKSAIGKTATYKCITKDQIKHRMNGFKSKKIMNDKSHFYLKDINPKLIDLHDKKIERLRDKAAELNFYSYFTFKRRQTFYSTRLNKTQLIEAVYENKEKREKRRRYEKRSTPQTR